MVLHRWESLWYFTAAGAFGIFTDERRKGIASWGRRMEGWRHFLLLHFFLSRRGSQWRYLSRAASTPQGGVLHLVCAPCVLSFFCFFWGFRCIFLAFGFLLMLFAASGDAPPLRCLAAPQRHLAAPCGRLALFLLALLTSSPCPRPSGPLRDLAGAWRGAH